MLQHLSSRAGPEVIDKSKDDSSLRMLLLEVLDPLHDPGDVRFEIVVVLALELNDDFLVVGFARFVEEDLEDFGIEVLLKFDFVVVSRRTQIELEQFLNAMQSSIAHNSKRRKD